MSPPCWPFLPFPFTPDSSCGGGGIAGLWRFPPSPVSGHTRRACASDRGVPPPLPLLVGVPPSPLPCMPCAGSARCLGGCPFVLLLVRGSPLLPLLHAMRKVRTLPFGGSPFFSALRLCASCSRCTPLYPSRVRVARAARWGVTPPLLSPGLALGARAARSEGTPLVPGCAPWACADGWGVHPLLPPLGGRTR